MSDEPDPDADERDVITTDDIAVLNRGEVDRIAGLGSTASIALLAAGALVLAGWLWQLVRVQQQLESRTTFASSDGFVPASAGPDLVDRIDASMSSLGYLAFAAFVIAIALLLRVTCAYAQARVGGNTTGLEPGAPLPPATEVELEPDGGGWAR